MYRQSATEAPARRSRLGAMKILRQHAPTLVGTEAWNEGITLLSARGPPGFWVFLDEHDRLEPDCLERMAGVFASRPDIGVITPWTERAGAASRLDARPCPTLTHQMTGNDVAPASGFNARALDADRPFKPGLPREYDVWALANAVIAKGWGSATLPYLLAHRTSPLDDAWAKATALRAIRAETLQPFDTAENRLALQIVDAYVPVAEPRTEPAPGGQRVRRFFLRGLEAFLLRPQHALRRCAEMTTRFASHRGVKP
jgi:hypothetical protein